MAPRLLDKTFKQILLFSLSDINQYRPREMHKIYDMLGEFAQLSEITTDNLDDLQKECFFYVDQDQPPKSRRSFDPKNKSTVYHLSTVKVAEHLYNYAIENPSGHGSIKSY